MLELPVKNDRWKFIEVAGMLRINSCSTDLTIAKRSSHPKIVFQLSLIAHN
jgi:hypothetical protein